MNRLMEDASRHAYHLALCISYSASSQGIAKGPRSETQDIVEILNATIPS